MDSLVGWDKLALVGDSSHPSAGQFLNLDPDSQNNRTDKTSGGFGSGSAYAMADSWTLARAIEDARSNATSDSIPGVVAEALKIFDTVRRPYYTAM